MSDDFEDSNGPSLSSRRSSNINKKHIFSKQIKDITKTQPGQEKLTLYKVIQKPNHTILNSFDTFEMSTTNGTFEDKPAKVQKSANIDILKLKISKENLKETPLNSNPTRNNTESSHPETFLTERQLPKTLDNGPRTLQDGDFMNLILHRNNSLPVPADLEKVPPPKRKEDIKNLLEFCRKKNSSKNNDPKLGMFGTFSIKNMKEYLGQRPQ